MRLGKFFIGFSFLLMFGVNRSWGKIKILSGRNSSPFRRKFQSFPKETPVLFEENSNPFRKGLAYSLDIKNEGYSSSFLVSLQ